MVIVYTHSGNSSCRKAIQWFKENEIDFLEIKVTQTPMTRIELIELLEHTENGLDDLLSRIGKDMGFDDMHLEQAIALLISFPQFLKYPIIYDGVMVQTGYHDQEIRGFMPRERRVPIVGLPLEKEADLVE